MHLREWLAVLASGASSVETVWAREGEPVVIRCTRQGDMIRFEEPDQVLAIKFTNTQAQYLAPRASVWRLDDSNRVDDHSLSLRIDSMTAETARSVSCVDENGITLEYRVNLLIPPRVTFGLISAAELKQGDKLKAFCEVTGGAPAPSIRWSNSIGTKNFTVDETKAESLSQSAPSVVRSELTYAVDASFHRQRFTCLVDQMNNSTPFELDEVFVEYAPRRISFSMESAVDEGSYVQTPTCTADAYPTAKITYQISLNQGEWSAFNPASRQMDLSDNGALVRCRAANTRDSSFSEPIKLQVYRKATPVKLTTTPTTSARPTKATSDEQSAAVPSQLATEVEKSGKNGIILSIIGSGAFLVVVLFGFVLRRFVRRGEGQTYKTDELSDLDEGISLHDPELEAHKKKEYFM